MVLKLERAGKDLIVIPDVHGDLHALQASLYAFGLVDPRGVVREEIARDSKVIFLGDYIHKGTQSLEVLEYLVNFKKQVESVFLCGNHELMYLTMMNAVDFDFDVRVSALMAKHHGGHFLSQLGINETNPALIKNAVCDVLNGSYAWVGEFFSGCQPLYEESGILFVHGGVSRSGFGILEREGSIESVNRRFQLDMLMGFNDGWLGFLSDDAPSSRGFMWSRINEINLYSQEDVDYISGGLTDMGISHIVCGHTPHENIVISSLGKTPVIDLDTGISRCFRGGRSGAAGALINEDGCYFVQDMNILMYHDLTRI